MVRRPAPVLAAALAAVLAGPGCSRDMGLPQPSAPQLTVRSLSPNPAVGGQVITAVYDASAEVLSCQAIIGPLFGSCEVVPPTTCRCTALVPEDLTESVFAANLAARSAGGEGRVFEPIGVDQKAPKVTASRITFTQREGAWSVVGAPAAVVDAIAGTAAVRVYAQAQGGAPLLALAPRVDGSLAATTVTGAPPAELWIEAEDRVGHVARVRAGQVDVQAGLAGRARFQPSPVHLAPYLFDADYHPTSAGPGLGPVARGEATAADAPAAAAPGDLAEAVTTAVAETLQPHGVVTTHPAGTPAMAAPSQQPHYVGYAHDAARRRTVVFGLQAQVPVCAPELCPPDYLTQLYPPDVWEFDGEAWTSVRPPGPSGRMMAPTAYDAGRGRVVLFGGVISSPLGLTRLNDTWEWDGQAWTSVSTPHAPTPRSGARLAYDAARGRLVLHGGYDATSNCDGGFQTYCTGTWAYDGRDWTLLTAVAPTPVRWQPGVAWSPVTGGVVLFGGGHTQNVSAPLFYGDVWAVDGASWSRPTLQTLAALQNLPYGATYDLARQRFQVVNWVNGPGNALFELTGQGIAQVAQGSTLVPLVPAYDPVRRVTYGVVGMTEMAVQDLREAHRRFATHAFALDVPAGATLTSLSLRHAGGGSGDGASGLTLWFWSWASRRWDLGGSHGNASTTDLVVTPPGPAAEYLEAGGTKVWVMAVAPGSDLAGAVPSRLATDFVRVRATYTLP